MSLKIDSFFEQYSYNTSGFSVANNGENEQLFDFSSDAGIGDITDFSETTHIKKTISKKEVSTNNTAKPKITNIVAKVPDTGTTDPIVLNQAPNPLIEICGKPTKAVIVVDLSTNVLYKYDKEGKPEIAYRIASGKKSTPTDRGVRIVTHKEKYPYRGAPSNSKRRQTPRAFGPFIICVNKIDPKTGEQSSTGEFIHGTNAPETPKNGMYASHGCMRMNNSVITKLKDEVQAGDIIVIK